ncbi:hypothetical protein ACQ4LE_009282 [Meloidogyne hapla]
MKNGFCQGNDSLEELVRQLKLSFLANSNNVNDEIKRTNNQKSSNIFSCLSSHLSNGGSKDFICNSSKVTSEFLPQISSKNDHEGSLSKRKFFRKQRIIKKPVNYFRENAQACNEFGKLWQTDKFLVKFTNSRLLIEFKHCHLLENSTRGVCGPAYGYSKMNAKYAISRLIRRDLLKIENTIYMKAPVNFRWSEENICRKSISVPSLDISSVYPRLFTFEGNGLNNDEAETGCNLRILEELCDFDLVKEANLEMYTRGRKELLDPTRKLNHKLFAWLEASTDTWVIKMNEIETSGSAEMEMQLYENPLTNLINF